MKLTLALISFLSAFLCAINPRAKAESNDINDTVTLTGIEGEGRNETEATQAALLNAVRMVCGEYVQVKAEIVDKKFKEKLLSLSNGKILDYTVTSQTSTSEGISVTVSCKVVKFRPFVSNDHVSSETTIDAKKLWAGTMSRNATKRQAFDFLCGFLPQLTGSYFKMRAINLEDPANTNAFPTLTVLDDGFQTGRTKLGVQLLLEPDYEAWSSAFPAIKEAFDALADNREEFTAVVRPVTDPTTGLRTTSRTSRKTSKSATSVTGPSYTRFLSTISRDDYQNIFAGGSRKSTEIVVLGDSPNNRTPELKFYRYTLPLDTLHALRSRTLPTLMDQSGIEYRTGIGYRTIDPDLWCDIKIRLISEAGDVLGSTTVYLAMNTMLGGSCYYMGPILRSVGLSTSLTYFIERDDDRSLYPQFLSNGRLVKGPILLVTGRSTEVKRTLTGGGIYTIPLEINENDIKSISSVRIELIPKNSAASP